MLFLQLAQSWSRTRFPLDRDINKKTAFLSHQRTWAPTRIWFSAPRWSTRSQIHLYLSSECCSSTFFALQLQKWSRSGRFRSVPTLRKHLQKDESQAGFSNLQHLANKKRLKSFQTDHLITQTKLNNWNTSSGRKICDGAQGAAHVRRLRAPSGKIWGEIPLPVFPNMSTTSSRRFCWKGQGPCFTTLPSLRLASERSDPEQLPSYPGPGGLRRATARWVSRQLSQHSSAARKGDDLPALVGALAWKRMI